MTEERLSVRKIDLERELERLFELDSRVSKAAPALLPHETKEKLKDFLVKDHASETWVWEDRSGRFGASLSLIDKPDEDELEILRIAIDPEFQNKGYGREMMEFAEKMAKDAGRKRLTLATSTKNEHAIGFYKRMGYRIVEERDNYYGEGEKRFLLEKDVE